MMHAKPNECDPNARKHWPSASRGAAAVLLLSGALAATR